MENQGYEGEQSRAEKEQSATPIECRDRDRQLRPGTIDGDPFVARATTAHSESHVYEDISAGTVITSGFSERIIPFPDGGESRNARGVEDSVGQVWTNGSPSSASVAIDESLQPDSTLVVSSSAGISANRDSTSFSSRAMSRSSEDDPVRSYGDPSCLSQTPTLSGAASESVSSSQRENEDSSRDAIPIPQSDRRPNRRRRKKDCKHCRSKLAGASSCERLDELADGKDAIPRENGGNHRDKDADAPGFLFRESLLRSQNVKIYPIISRSSLRDVSTRRSFTAVNPVSEVGPRFTKNATILMNAANEKMSGQTTENSQHRVPGVPRNGTDMRVNSIYSQDRWYGKESPIFYTDVKDQNPFQRAYSLPARTHTPASQNRVNLRRSVRNEPAPHPARLDKHRRGWTLHLARPLKASGCSSPLVPLLIVVLILLGVAGVALYIVFEPEKLQIIQQYLKSSTGKLTGQNVTSGESFTPVIPNDEPNLAITGTRTTSTTTTTTPTMTTTASMMMMMGASADDAFALLNGGQSFPGSISPPTDAEAEAASRNPNATRYCDDCLEGEVCVALVDEQVPICRVPHDREDPTGCAGFCIINKQKCHRLDVDAFRCVEMEHYCLDDEWTCSNTLCIPLEKRCDGHMNCYDHSDEYDCVCDPGTHFQCGNETSCLPLERRCDGKIDCWDATDEINCTLACPLDSEFTCSDGECILKVRFCDGLPDCTDGSDEPHGCQGRCNKHEFTCQNGRCITKGMKCNGIDDCGDGTDERYCKDRFT